ncbi:MAG: hypothetical protein KIT48_04590 [Pseudolabrys sp.]|nr:hypothetical protein [Pseudolabrys sp.]
MTKPNGTDLAQMEMMTALLKFKRTHGDAAYLALLAKFNADRWSQIPATAHGEVTMRCSAGIKGLEIKPAQKRVEAEDDDTASIQDRLGELAAKIYGGPKQNDFAIIAANAPDLKTAFDRFATATHARHRSK